MYPDNGEKLFTQTELDAAFARGLSQGRSERPLPSNNVSTDETERAAAARAVRVLQGAPRPERTDA